MTGRRQSIFKKILVGFDGSEQSKKAADTAVGLARCLDAKILLLAVAQPPEPSDGENNDQFAAPALP